MQNYNQYSTVSTASYPIFNAIDSVEISLDVQFQTQPEGAPPSLLWEMDGYRLFATSGSINMTIPTATGGAVQQWVKTSVFESAAVTRLSITIDVERNTLQVTAGSEVLIDRADLDLKRPDDVLVAANSLIAGNSATAFGNVLVSDVAASPPALTSLKADGYVVLDFDDGIVPQGMALIGGASLSSAGSLQLSGGHDRAVVREKQSLEGADQLTVELDVRFDDPDQLGPAKVIWNHGAYGITLTGTSINTMVQTADDGAQFDWRGNLEFDDLQWHSIVMNIDTVGNSLVVQVDGEIVAERYDLDLALPSTPYQTTIGASTWGAGLNGEIDNVTITTLDEVPDASGSAAVGMADPSVMMNTNGYVKWFETATAPFIDRMKGALAWSGQKPVHYIDKGDVYTFADVDAIIGSAAPKLVSFNDQTLLNINQLVTMARWVDQVIDQTQYKNIAANPLDYFKIGTGADGNSELLGRFDTNDAYSVIARFDSDIGVDLATLRANGQANLSPGDTQARYDELQLDENGWPIHLPQDITGAEGRMSSIVLWYPEEVASIANSIYSGKFYLIAEGEGTLSLKQTGTSVDRVNLSKIQVDGPTVIPFDYTPDGNFVELTLHRSDPNDTGNYLRNIKIIHEDHMPLYEAGEIFTPEFVELHQDHRVVRWMAAMETNHNPEFAAGNFDDRPGLDFYTFNLGTGPTEPNGVPIDAIVAFSNKTGTDPWINIPVNASDAYVQGMAAYIEQHLDPKLKVYAEFGNENWNGAFDTYRYTKAQALDRWGEMKLMTDAAGTFLRDANGDLVVLEDGYFFDHNAATKNGYITVGQIANELGLAHSLYPTSAGWIEWSAMRATEVASIFKDAFDASDPAATDGRLNNVLGTQTIWSKASDMLLKAKAWQQAEPGSWIDPGTVFDSMAVGAYFGGTAGAKDSDMVRFWIDNFGTDYASDMMIRHLQAGLDETQTFIKFAANTLNAQGIVYASKVQTGVDYSADLIIDVFDVINMHNHAVRNAIQFGDAMTKGTELLIGDDALRYVQLTVNAAGNSELQLRIRPDAGSPFQTILEFNGVVDKTVEEMIQEGTLFVRSMQSMEDVIKTQLGPQAKVAEAHGLELLAYEGGQHLAAAIWGVYKANLNDPTLTNFFTDVSNSAEIAGLYDTWIEAWRDLGGDGFAQFIDYELPSQYGNFGTLSYLGQNDDPGQQTLRHDYLENLNQQGTWWTENRAADAFLHGTYQDGTAGDDDITGTVEEDVLLGGDGDDHIFGGDGDDAIHGGSGKNILDGGAGNDILVAGSVDDQIDGGQGIDTMRIVSDIQTLDFSVNRPASIEILDTRNNAVTQTTLHTADVFAFNNTHSVRVWADSVDEFVLHGFAFDRSTVDGDLVELTYAGLEQSETVEITIVAGQSFEPDIILAA